jgi:hypothetical protein
MAVNDWHVTCLCAAQKVVDRNFLVAYEICLHCGLMPSTLAQFGRAGAVYYRPIGSFNEA